MLHYPKIPGSGNSPGSRCIAFEKYDGTNLHWDWDRDFGWHAFGTRRDVFNLTRDGVNQFVCRHMTCTDALKRSDRRWPTVWSASSTKIPRTAATNLLKYSLNFSVQGHLLACTVRGK